MARRIVHAAVGLALVASGWAIARAQASEPDFVIAVDAPGGSTSVRCVRGCTLAWVERGLNPNSTPTATFEFECTAGRCQSGRVGGWVK